MCGMPQPRSSDVRDGDGLERAAGGPVDFAVASYVPMVWATAGAYRSARSLSCRLPGLKGSVGE